MKEKLIDTSANKFTTTCLPRETVSSHVCIKTRAERQEKVTTKPGKTVNMSMKLTCPLPIGEQISNLLLCHRIAFASPTFIDTIKLLI